MIIKQNKKFRSKRQRQRDNAPQRTGETHHAFTHNILLYSYTFDDCAEDNNYYY